MATALELTKGEGVHLEPGKDWKRTANKVIDTVYSDRLIGYGIFIGNVVMDETESQDREVVLPIGERFAGANTKVHSYDNQSYETILRGITIAIDIRQTLEGDTK